MTSQLSAPYPQSLPTPPTTGFMLDWDRYRHELRLSWDGGLLNHDSWLEKLTESHSLEMATRTRQTSLGQSSSSKRVNPRVPAPGALVAVCGAQLRRASVLILLCRGRSTSLQVHNTLTRNGFTVSGKRPAERVRKALVLECAGTALRPPAVTRSTDGYFSADRTLLTDRTRQRWMQEFPTLRL
jgi:hypothetical protein